MFVSSGQVSLFPYTVLSPTCTMLDDLFQRKMMGLFTIMLSEGANIEQSSGAELQIRISDKILISYQLNFNKLNLFPFYTGIHSILNTVSKSVLRKQSSRYRETVAVGRIFSSIPP